MSFASPDAFASPAAASVLASLSADPRALAIRPIRLSAAPLGYLSKKVQEAFENAGFITAGSAVIKAELARDPGLAGDLDNAAAFLASSQAGGAKRSRQRYSQRGGWPSVAEAKAAIASYATGIYNVLFTTTSTGRAAAAGADAVATAVGALPRAADALGARHIAGAVVPVVSRINLENLRYTFSLLAACITLKYGAERAAMTVRGLTHILATLNTYLIPSVGDVGSYAAGLLDVITPFATELGISAVGTGIVLSVVHRQAICNALMTAYRIAVQTAATHQISGVLYNILAVGLGSIATVAHRIVAGGAAGARSLFSGGAYATRSFSSLMRKFGRYIVTFCSGIAAARSSAHAAAVASPVASPAAAATGGGDMVADGAVEAADNTALSAAEAASGGGGGGGGSGAEEVQADGADGTLLVVPAAVAGSPPGAIVVVEAVASDPSTPLAELEAVVGDIASALASGSTGGSTGGPAGSSAGGYRRRQKKLQSRKRQNKGRKQNNRKSRRSLFRF